MGKVASTSIVSALNTLDGVEAVQSHFLGQKALCETVQHITNPRTGSYFLKHQIGQLMLNIETTRHIEGILAGADERKLVTLSLARDPADWFRSSLLQDMEGYLPDLIAFGGDKGDDDTEVALERGLTAFLGQVADLSRGFENADTFFATLRSDPDLTGNQYAGWSQAQKRILFMMFRPTVWFKQHYAAALRHGLEDMTLRDGVWWREYDAASHAILRYEDLDTAFPVVCQHAFGQAPALNRQNTSREKPHNAAVARAFATQEAEALRKALRTTSYARFFAYG
jgi:hypothetical protein